ncbi:NAD-dependent epimerase/dehydratase family protein [Burkholderia contaminans]|nr:NAD-dependent epimerase/dehydratase family protein [Burkholderia contaminans]
MNRVVVTGANGFVGRALSRALIARGHAVTGLVRKAGGCVDGVREWLYDGGDFAGIADAQWPDADCVVHLAACVHVMNDAASDVDSAFRATNVDGTLRVAEAARRRGVRRFVFVSSIKAIAESDGGRPLVEDDHAHPEDAYGRSKLEAESALREFAVTSGLDVVIVRPPLVYGPHVRANFLGMMDVIWKGVPLPLGAIAARRSLVYVDNLADVLVRCATDPRAAQGCFHVADDDAPTVTELLRMVGDALDKRARLFPVPAGALKVLGRLTGRSAAVDRLTTSLQVDSTHVTRVLNWHPPFTTRQGLAATAAWYRSRDTQK